MAVRQRIVVLNQRQRHLRSQLMYVHYFIRENFSPLATMSEDTILQKCCLPREQIQQLLHLFGPTLLRHTRRSYPQVSSIVFDGRARGFHVKAVHKTELSSQMLLYQKLYAKLNENDIQNVLKTVGFLQKYSDIKTTALGFDFEACSAQPSILPTSQPFKFSQAGLSL